MPAEVLYREMPIALVKRDAAEGEAKPDTNLLTFSVSSETPVMRGGEGEILRHDERSVRLDRLRTLGCTLVNHDPNQRGAAIVAANVVNSRLVVSVRFGSTAFAQDVKRDVEDGLLRGVSMMYRIYAIEEDAEARTYTATDWEPFEVTFTPIPADATVGVGRSAPESWQSIRSLLSNNSAANAAPSQRSIMPDPIQPVAPAPVAAAPAVVPAAHDEAVRSAVIQAQREIAEITLMAESVSLRASDYTALGKEAAKAKIIADMAERSKTPAPASPVASMTYDHADKQRDAVAEAFMVRANLAKPVSGNPYLGRSIRKMAQMYARESGIRGAVDWEAKDASHFVLGENSQIQGMRDSVNITTGNFTGFVMLNAMTKVTAKGFEMAQKGLVGQSGAPIYDTQKVPDFKSYYVGGLGTGNLQQTAEGTAFPELTKTEGTYNDTAKMWGGTLSLSLQALISDDTAAFDRSLRQIGPIAQKTIEKRLIEKFLRGVATTDASTWTNNTTSGGTPVFTTADTVAAARANVGKAPAALMGKIGLDGNPLGNMTRFLLAGPTAGLYLAGILGQAPGQIAQNAGAYELVVTPWLEATAITGYSTTSYYAVSDPSLVTGLILSLINGYESPQIQEYDAGAVGARKWKAWMPMEADLFWFTNAAGTNVIPGAQQATT